MGKQHQAMEEDSIKIGKTHAHAKSIVRQCYEHERGCTVGSWVEEETCPYLDWCEEKANLWIAMLDDWGYHGWSDTIQTLTGSITYHDWLKKEVGL